MKIGLLGYGSFGKQIHFLLKEIYSIEDGDITIFDDVLQPSSSDRFTIKSFSSVFNDEYIHHQIYVCLGYHHLTLKQSLINQLLEKEYSLPNLIHPSTNISKYAIIGSGNIFFSGCNIDLFTTIGNGNIFYNQACIAHDVKIKDCNFFAPSVTICGNVNINNANFFGARVAVANGIAIGDQNKIGIGSVVTRNITSNISGVGFPFKTLFKDLDLK